MRVLLAILCVLACTHAVLARPRTETTLAINKKANDADQVTTTSNIELQGTFIDLEVTGRAGLLFENVPIERGFTVNSAKLGVTSQSTNNYAAVTTIRAEKTCTPAVYGVVPGDDKDKDKDDDKDDDKEKDKSNSVDWHLLDDKSKDKDKTPTPPPPTGLSARTPLTDASVAWSTAWIKETRYNVDLPAVIQEIVNQPSWVKGSSISLLFTGEGGNKRRQAYTWDNNPAKAPTLTLNYDVPAQCANLDQTATYTVHCEAGAYGLGFEGTTCTQVCDAGYRGCDSTRVCGSDGQWTGANVVCTALVQSSPGDLAKKLLNDGTGPYHCNDGTSPSYYIRQSKSNKWIIMFEGGGLCFNAQTCGNRIVQTPFFVSSTWNPNNPVDIFNAPTRVGNGILSKDATTNPYWADANVVFVHYCSSDMWSGTRTATVALSATLNYWFQGHYIMYAVIDELRARYDLGCADKVLIAGEAASGAVGLSVQLERLSNYISAFAPQARIDSLMDGGFVIPVVDPLKLFNPAVPKVNDIIAASQPVWQPIISPACEAAGFTGANAWKCFFAAENQPNHVVPTFYYQAQYDMPQVGQNGVVVPIDTQAEMDYTDVNLAQPVKDNFYQIRLTPRDGGFTPRCQGHKLADKPEWSSTNINGLIYRDAFQQWYDRTDRSNPTATFVTVDECVGFSCNPTCPLVWI